MRKTFSLPVAATAAGGGPTPPPPADTVDNIEHSVRLNSADSAQLTKTFSSAGNTETNTISLWVKRNKISYALDTYQSFLSAGNNFIWHFDTADRLGLYQGGFIRYTTQKFRDPSAWYHFVFATDTTQSAASDQIKVYVNGQLITDWDVETALTQNTTLTWNSNVLHNIGSNNNTQYPDIQIADVQSIDGQALTPSSFGFTDSNGVWQPKAYTGSYGTNGFHLDFADTSSATALGNDVSGNNNDFTPSGLVAGPAYTANSFSTEFDGTGDYLTITNSTDHNPGTGDFTIEGWFKTSATVSYHTIISKYGAPDTNHGFYFGLDSAGTGFRAALFDGSSGTPLELTGGTSLNNGSWHHFAVSRSGTSAKLFIDGTLVSSATNSFDVTATSDLQISGYPGTSRDWNGQLSNIRMIKGRALYTAAFTPPSTALTAVTDTVLLTCQDSTFIDNSASAHTITANGDAATTTVSPFEPVDGSDAMLDSPTNYGSGDTVRGNYCTLNPLTGSSAFTLTNGNLDVSDSGAASPVLMGTVGVNSGKWYWEVTLGTATAYVGASQVTSTSSVGFLGATSGQFMYNTNSVSSSYINGSGYNYSTASTATTGDVIGVALNFDSNEITFYKNGVSQGVFGSNVLGTSTWTPAFKSNASTSATFNFGQQPFKYPLAGYKSLCSTNLPTPAVADGSTAMDVALYTGTSSALAVSTPNMSPDLVWIKRRNNTWAPRLYDSIRGAGTATALYPDRADTEGSLNAEDLDSFDSTGFTVGPASPLNGINATGEPFVAWTWDAGSSTVSNTDGAITSQVRANPTAGISVVSYTGTLTAAGNTTVGHGLSNAPALVITKGRNETATWIIQSSALGANEYLEFSTAAAQSSTAVGAGALPKPTSSVFYTSWLSGLGGNGINHIAYCFAPVEGFSAFGSYTGSTDLPFVYTGFRPRWLMVKHVSGSIAQQSNAWWVIVDTERSDFNDVDKRLHAHNSDSEYTTSNLMDICSNGFKFRSTGSAWNYAGGTYIYAAFAEHPFKTSRAR